MCKRLQQKQSAKPAAQLKYVSQQLDQNATSGSGKTYAQGFAQAAAHFKGTEITLESILPLIQMILGGGQANSSAGSSTDIIGSILGGLLGGQSSSSASQSGQGGGLGGLLGGLLGGQSGSSSNAGGDLLGTLIGGLVGNSKMADSAPHTESGQIVTSSILQALSQLLGQ